VPLLGATLVIGMLNGVISAFVETYLRVPASHAVYYRFGVPSLSDRMIYALAIAPLFGLIVFVSIIFLIASLMSAERGSLKERAFQVARPYLLVEIINGLILLFINQPITAIQQTPIGNNPLAFLILAPLTLATLVYYSVAILNALAAGSGRNRWLLFGAWLLISLITVFVVPYGVGALLYHFGIHMAVPF